MSVLNNINRLSNWKSKIKERGGSWYIQETPSKEIERTSSDVESEDLPESCIIKELSINNSLTFLDVVGQRNLFSCHRLGTLISSCD